MGRSTHLEGWICYEEKSDGEPHLPMLEKYRPLLYYLSATISLWISSLVITSLYDQSSPRSVYVFMYLILLFFFPIFLALIFLLHCESLNHPSVLSCHTLSLSQSTMPITIIPPLYYPFLNLPLSLLSISVIHPPLSYR
jgi:hypothetical protein